jgi:hypothetical protein
MDPTTVFVTGVGVGMGLGFLMREAIAWLASALAQRGV